MNFVFRRFSFAVLSRKTLHSLQYPKVTSVASGLHSSTATLADLAGKHIDRGSAEGESGPPQAKAATSSENPLGDEFNRLLNNNPFKNYRIIKEILRQKTEGKDIKDIQNSLRLSNEYMKSISSFFESSKNKMLYDSCDTCKKIYLHPAPVNESETPFYQRNGAKTMEQQLDILTDATKLWKRGSHNLLSLSGWDPKDCERILSRVQAGMDYERRKSGSRARLVAYLQACLVMVSKKGYYEYGCDNKPSDDTEDDRNVSDEENRTCEPNVAAASRIPIRDGFSSDDLEEVQRILKTIFRMCKEGRTRQEIQSSLGISDKYLKQLLEFIMIANDVDNGGKKKKFIEKCKSCNKVLLNPLPSSKFKTYRENKAMTTQQQLDLLSDAFCSRSGRDLEDADDVMLGAYFDLEWEPELKSRIHSRTHLIVYLHACLVYVSLDYQEDYI